MLSRRVGVTSGSRRARAGCAALLALAVSACGGKPQDLSTEQLSSVVDVERGGLKRCYDAALRQSPYKQEIRMEAAVHIASSGRVSAVQLDGGGGLPGMNACIREAILHWRFPQARDATHTSLPLIFRPEIQPPKPNLDMIRQALQQVGAKPTSPP